MTDSRQDDASEAEWTCGKGLAQHASIPAKMAEYLEVLAENLQAHVPTIDTSDASGREEREAYVDLRAAYGSIAARLAATAERMRGYRDLPPAAHHDEALAGSEVRRAFQRLVSIEAELAELLREAADRDGKMLRQG